jgi:hypothetical protein
MEGKVKRVKGKQNMRNRCSRRYWLTADPGMNLRSIWSQNGGAYGGPIRCLSFLEANTGNYSYLSHVCTYTEKKENQIFLAVAKSYMRKGFLIYE